MGFTTIAFILFLPLLVGIHHLAPKQMRWVVLLIGSYFFYGFVEPYLLLIILSLTFISYAWGRILERQKSKLILSIGVVITLSFLLLFKYADFFGLVVHDITSVFHGASSEYQGFSIVLPIGISFYTFQAISYLVDIYRDKIEPEKHLGYYSLYLVFFPQLVAGPIEKSNDLIPQLKNSSSLTWGNFSEGSKMILLGMFKKIVIANNLLPVINKFYIHSLDSASAVEMWIIIIGFVYYVYADFSGYCDIAIGCARLFGVKLTQNFNKPFSSLNFREFWRRWHVTLASWITDYLYIPLGGKIEKKPLRTFINVMTVFILMGLWHGASYNFLLFGFFGGLFVIIDASTKDFRKPYFEKMNLTRENWLSRVIFRTTILFGFAYVGMFSLSESLQDSILITSKLFSFSKPSSLSILAVFMILTGIFLLEVINHFTPEKEAHPFNRIKSPALRIISYSLLSLIISLFFFTNKINFYYFQF